MPGEILDIIGISLIFLLFAGVVIAIPLRQRYRRNHLRTRGLANYQRKYLQARSSLYRILPGKLRRELSGTINIFLDEMEFEACGGLEEVSDEMKLLIASQACILMLKNKLAIFPKLQSILVYPGAYIAGGSKSMLGGRIVDAPPSVRLGESWSRGNIVLAWDQVKADADTYGTGHNVTIHEFAHQLAQQDGSQDGFPFRHDPVEQQEWAEILYREFEHLREETEHGHREVIDSYGAVNQAEFFAVSTETFFCASAKMRKYHPDLYCEFTEYYCTNPESWSPDKQ
jgi:MtfA peptidase